MKSTSSLEKIKHILEFKKKQQEVILLSVIKSKKQKLSNINRLGEIILSYGLKPGEINTPNYFKTHDLFIANLFFLIEHEKTLMKKDESLISSLQTKLSAIQVKIDYIEKKINELKIFNKNQEETFQQKSLQQLMILEGDRIS